MIVHRYRWENFDQRTRKQMEELGKYSDFMTLKKLPQLEFLERINSWCPWVATVCMNFSRVHLEWKEVCDIFGRISKIVPQISVICSDKEAVRPEQEGM